MSGPTRYVDPTTRIMDKTPTASLSGDTGKLSAFRNAKPVASNVLDRRSTMPVRKAMLVYHEK